ncbi:unnamed protein product [Moneuplotes crassus]|uniref:Uncharacterized protein n=1 Tax=Euplotes crassus TaxID=5936 RepID=A0AAD2D8X4_EUPCR|nr:unnamed protein product [Moneuplotes crassus]
MILIFFNFVRLIYHLWVSEIRISFKSLFNAIAFLFLKLPYFLILCILIVDILEARSGGKLDLILWKSLV